MTVTIKTNSQKEFDAATRLMNRRKKPSVEEWEKLLGKARAAKLLSASHHGDKIQLALSLKKSKAVEPYFPKTDVVCPECGERFHITADPDAHGKKCECPACECKLLTVVQQMGDRLAWSVTKEDTRPKGPTAIERSEAGL